VAIQGFGNVAQHAALRLVELGARVVMVSDENGGVHNEGGLEIEALIQARDTEPDAPLADLANGDACDNREVLAAAADILMPAAIENVITADNAGDVAAKMVVEAANLPVTCEADAILRDAGVEIVPDLLVNAGGVTVSYFEWAQNSARANWTREQTCERLEEKLDAAWSALQDTVDGDRRRLRQGVYDLAVKRICDAIHLRGF
jgi:glutamate dehydrogenase/leucine dehydrogenase